MSTGRAFPEVEHEEVNFDDVVMKYYKLVVTEHDELAYHMIPKLQALISEPAVLNRSGA